MYFTVYITKTGLYLNNHCNISEVMLYNGQKVLVSGPSGDSKGAFVPGDLVEFRCVDNGADKIDLEKDQPDGEYYKLSHSWCCRVTNEQTIKTFFLGAKILDAPGKITSKVRRSIHTFVSWFRKPMTA